MAQMTWLNFVGLPSRNWTCGHCGRLVGNDKGFQYEHSRWAIYLCPACNRPTFFEVDKQVPGATYGNMVDNLPGDIGPLYQESRNCMTVSAYTAAVLTCRKILLHIAVEKGAPEKSNFEAAVDHLITANVIPVHFKTWVDHIRLKSNKANHKIVLMGLKDAEDLLSFTEMLLKVVYEYPARVTAAGS
jgi:Domain of unknown function (DUF4145)